MDTPQTKRPLFYLIVVLVLSLVQASCSFSTSAVPTVPANESVVSTETLPAPASPTATKLDGSLLVVIDPIADENIDLQNSFLLTANGFGANAKKYDGSFDTNQEISLVNDAIAAGAKGIAIQVFSPVTSLGPTISKAAKAAGVTLIAITTSIKDESGKPIPIVRFDDKDMGTKVGEAAAKLLTDSGWLKDSTKKVGVLSLEVRNQPFCNIRTNNEKAAIKAAGIPNKQIFPLPYDNIMVDSQNTTGPILRAHPDITNWVVFGCDDHGVAGSLQALAAAGVKNEDVIGIGLGTSEACFLWTSGQPTAFKAALNISYQDVGRTAATVLYDAVVNGKIPPAVMIVSTNIVDATNFKTLMDPAALSKCNN